MRPATKILRPALRFFLAAILLAMCVQCVSAQNKQDKKALKAQAEALLAKSRDLSNIEAPGSPPFVLTAQLRFLMDGKTGAGQGEIIWLGPGHYRETYSAPSYHYVEIAKDGKRYLWRTENEMPLLIYELKMTLSAAMQPRSFDAKRIKSVTTLQDASGHTLTCPRTNSNSVVRTVCFDADGDVTSMKTELPSSHATMDSSYEFSGFAAFGLRRVPLNMKFNGGDGHEVAVAVQRIAPIMDVSAQNFHVSAGSMEEPWCAEPKAKYTKLLTEPQAVATSLHISLPLTTTVYLEVGPGGRPRNVTLIHSSQPLRQEDLQKWFMSMQFPVEACGDDGIEYELEMCVGAPPSVLP